jgi:hypothetical protein
MGNGTRRESEYGKGFANATLEWARVFIKSLLTDENFASDLRTALEQHDTGRQVYLSMDEKMAKVLYAILKLQHPFLRPQSKGDGDRNIPPQADRKTLERFTGLSSDIIRQIINQLRAARYVLLGSLRRLHSAEGRSGEGHEVFELNVAIVISCADTATFLLELLDEAQKNVSEMSRAGIIREQGRKPDNEFDGKVNRKDFVKTLLDAKKLAYFSDDDLIGRDHRKGKIDEVIDAGEYIERVSITHIRPRMRIVLERLYLSLVARQIPLEDLSRYHYSSGKWRESTSSPTSSSSTSG